MNMLYTRPMPVADHFMAPWAYSDEQTAAANLGEVCETCYTHCGAGKTELWRHARDEHGADPGLSCQVPSCGRRFFAAAMCADHRAHHRNGGGGQRADHDIAGPNDRPPLTCELCGHLSINRSKYDRHVSAAHPEALAATCGVCHTYLGDVSSLIDHVQRRHALEICPDLSAAEQTSDSGSDPKGSHRRSIRCTVCGKRYGNNRFMYVHRRVHGLADDVFSTHPQSQWSGASTAMCSSPVHPQPQWPDVPTTMCSSPVHPQPQWPDAPTTMCSSPVHPQPQWPDSTTTMCSSPVHPQPQWSGASTAMCSSPVHPQLCSTPVNP